MKWMFMLVFGMLYPSAMLYTAADDVIGTWLTNRGKAKIQIYKSGNKYYGKIVWLREPNRDGKPKLDSKNPDAKLRNTPVVGLLMLKDFIYDDGEWTGGDIYDPESGKTYSCKMSMPDKNTLRVRGYIGISLFGRTEVWTRN